MFKQNAKLPRILTRLRFKKDVWCSEEEQNGRCNSGHGKTSRDNYNVLAEIKAWSLAVVMERSKQERE